MKPQTILAFDTSGPFCAAALLADGNLTSRVDDMARGQAEHLIPMLEEVLQSKGLQWQDLDAIAVGIGPGNFTGIRISVSAARGLALALNMPAIGVSGLDAARFGLSNVVACLPAPRGQAYVQAFLEAADDTPTLVDPTLNQSAIPGFPILPAKAEPRFCGAAAEAVAQAYLGGAFSAEVDIAPQPVPAIEAVARIAAQRLKAMSDHPAPAPLYIKPADAAPSREEPPVILS
ncbi:MAG: tRNA (adenosine(37)-N6)-threonylcarbamoyltransferase complex dimerization subunit type 1 TsaB [Pseudomonadota bacterium]